MTTATASVSSTGFLSNFVNSAKNWLTETESDVLVVITKIKAEEAVLATDIAAAQHWIASNAPTIAADVQQVLAIITEIGVTSNPDVAAAVTAANVAVTALNAFANATNAGAGAAQAVVSGYVAVKQAQAAVSTAKAAAVAAPTS